MSETKPDLTISLQETANSIEIQAADGTIVADLINEADCCVTESMRQYASLFAAAPDMLVALKAIRDARDYCAEHGKYPENTLAPDQEFDDWAADVAAAAIAKAGTQ